ncbi:MAG: UDP-2,3-diacylglucosamine diphosphatase LpxI [Deltaproteobacteria bacterium]|nr:UDP-2,3-diacylglucosamine diphosphatase LpxI [Deltaproteobacteria bacterium]
MTQNGPEPVGFIAGNHILPILAAKKAKERGQKVLVVGISGETDPELKELADYYEEVSLGQLKPLANFFLSHGCHTVSMAGSISRQNILSNYKPDEAAVQLMESLPNFLTDTILRSVAQWLEREGLKLVSVTDIVPELLVKPGQLGIHSPSNEILEDLILAFNLARELGRLDVGQTVVVCDKIAVALEGAEGTDETIRRGASLCSKPISVAKVLKPIQDTRFDLPVIGPSTIELLVEVAAGALVLDAKGLIVLEEERCISLANDAHIALLAWTEAPETRGTHGPGA